MPNDKIKEIKRALLIGVDTYAYPAIEALPAVANNITRLESVLRNPTLCEYTHVDTITGEQASLETICTGLDNIVLAATKPHTVLVYFAGHGYHEKGHTVGYLFSYDTEPDKLGTTALSTTELVPKLQEIKKQCTNLIVIIDACYADAAISMDYIRDIVSNTQNGGGVVVITSSTSTQQSYTRRATHGTDTLSCFTSLLLEGIEGKADSDDEGTITIKNLFVYIEGKIKKIQTECKQTPQIWPPVGSAINSSGDVASEPTKWLERTLLLQDYPTPVDRLPDIPFATDVRKKSTSLSFDEFLGLRETPEKLSQAYTIQPKHTDSNYQVGWALVGTVESVGNQDEHIYTPMLAMTEFLACHGYEVVLAPKNDLVKINIKSFVLDEQDNKTRCIYINGYDQNNIVEVFCPHPHESHKDQNIVCVIQILDRETTTETTQLQEHVTTCYPNSSIEIVDDTIDDHTQQWIKKLIQYGTVEKKHKLPSICVSLKTYLGDTDNDSIFLRAPIYETIRSYTPERQSDVDTINSTFVRNLCTNSDIRKNPDIDRWVCLYETSTTNIVEKIKLLRTLEDAYHNERIDDTIDDLYNEFVQIQPELEQTEFGTHLLILTTVKNLNRIVRTGITNKDKEQLTENIQTLTTICASRRSLSIIQKYRKKYRNRLESVKTIVYLIRNHTDGFFSYEIYENIRTITTVLQEMKDDTPVFGHMARLAKTIHELEQRIKDPTQQLSVEQEVEQKTNELLQQLVVCKRKMADLDTAAKHRIAGRDQVNNTQTLDDIDQQITALFEESREIERAFTCWSQEKGRDNLVALLAEDTFKQADDRVIELTLQMSNITRRVEEIKNEYQTKVTRLETNNKELLASKEQQQKDIAALQKEQQRLQQNIAALQKEQQEAQQNIAALQKEQQEAQQNIAALEAEKERLQSKINRMWIGGIILLCVILVLLLLMIVLK